MSDHDVPSVALATYDMFLNEKLSDVTFFVGESKTNSVRLPAHKLLLRFASSVFRTMFAGDFLEGETSEVLIQDISPAAFKQTLK